MARQDGGGSSIRAQLMLAKGKGIGAFGTSKGMRCQRLNEPTCLQRQQVENHSQRTREMYTDVVQLSLKGRIHLNY